MTLRSFSFLLARSDSARPGATQTQYLRYVELELSGDTAPLEKALQAEPGKRAPLEKHWYGTSSTLYRDYPVTQTAPRFLHIRWDVVPGARKLLAALQRYTVIADPVSLNQDFTHLKSLSREEQQKQLRELAVRGQNLTAMYVARNLYGCSLGEAKQMVDSLNENKVPPWPAAALSTGNSACTIACWSRRRCRGSFLSATNGK